LRYHTDWPSHYDALKHRTVLCEGHSVIECALRTRKGYLFHEPRRKTAYLCWIRNAYKVEGAFEWHAFCTKTPRWSEALLDATYSHRFNPFTSNRGYLRIRREHKPPNGLLSPHTQTNSEIAYLLNGDSTTTPKFNPWHGMADPINFFIVSRLLPSIIDSSLQGRAPNVTLYPAAGCSGMGPGRGSWAVWRSLLGHIELAPEGYWSSSHRAAGTRIGRRMSMMSGLFGVFSRSRSRNGVNPGINGVSPESFRWSANARANAPAHARSSEGRLRLVPLLLLSPSPSQSPSWQAQSAVVQCPHQSRILADFRRAVTDALDPALLTGGLLDQISHRDGVHLYGVPLTARRILVYVLRRSPGTVDIAATRKCHRWSPSTCSQRTP